MVVVLSGESGSHGDNVACAIFINPSTHSKTLGKHNFSAHQNIIWGENNVSWYTDYVLWGTDRASYSFYTDLLNADQLNVSGYQYYWVCFG